MTTTDTNALKERIARVLHEHWVAEPCGGTATEAWTNCTCGIRITVPGGTRDEAWRRGDAHQAEQIAAAVLPIVAEEVRKAKAEAWDEGCGAFEAAHKWDNTEPWGHLIENPYRETGDSDEHR